MAYTVAEADKEADKRITHVWMVSWDGKDHVQLTYGTESASSPQWSPDGKYLSFTSSRPGPAKGSQVWILDRRGGEARQLTNVKGSISDYTWSPDSKRLALVMREKDDQEPEDGKTPPEKAKPPKPIVIDRYHFKQDRQGYLAKTASPWTHLSLRY